VYSISNCRGEAVAHLVLGLPGQPHAALVQARALPGPRRATSGTPHHPSLDEGIEGDGDDRGSSNTQVGPPCQMGILVLKVQLELLWPHMERLDVRGIDLSLANPAAVELDCEVQPVLTTSVTFHGAVQ